MIESNFDLFGNPQTKKKDKKRTISNGEKKFLWTSKKRHICPICHKQIKDYFDAEFDHEKAHAKGGATSLANTLIVHKLCNRLKSDKTLTQIKKRIGTHTPKKRKKTTKKKVNRDSLGFEIPDMKLPKLKGGFQI